MLGYICTSDRALSRVGQACRLEAVLAFSPEVHRPLPILSFDPNPMQLKLSPATLAEISAIDTAWQQPRASRLPDSSERISYDALAGVIEELEAEVLRFCTG